jgi:hypothetical protein
LPAPDGSGGFGLALDLRRHEAILEHADGRVRIVPRTPNRAVREVIHDILGGVEDLAGTVEISPTPQETPWQTPLDEDTQHATSDTRQVERYFLAHTSYTPHDRSTSRSRLGQCSGMTPEFGQGRIPG